MNIILTNRQRQVKLSTSTLRKLTAFFMGKASAMQPDVTWVECSVVLVGHRAMIRLNEEVLRHEGTTDVITFHYPTAPGEEPAGRRGEIIINVEEAAEQARCRGVSTLRETALYLAHGCQHLGGADDATPSERAAMSRRQNRWLREAFALIS
jgi:rRNA maturation RNase YbeY